MEETVSLLKKSKPLVPVSVNIVDMWEDIPDTYDKPKLCKIEDPTCEACQ